MYRKIAHTVFGYRKRGAVIYLTIPEVWGKGAMDFVDRILKCSDCGNDFIFTAGEQLFFLDRQFKNDPKRCKLCKAKRAGLGAAPSALAGTATLPLSRTETRTECSACGVETTVPFRPTQGRPVFCRSCFQIKRVTPGPQITAPLGDPAAMLPTSLHDSFSMATMDMVAETPAAAMLGLEFSAANESLAMLEPVEIS